MKDEQSEQTAARRRILIVDDNADAADSLAMILNHSGHVAEAVYGAADALDRAAAFDPEIVLLDIGLPGIDGYEVARQLKGRGSNARLIALTGYGQPEDVRRAHDAGFDAHMVKPVNLQHLLRDLGSS
jgi:CheY-like chemotaxis protein